MWFLATEGLPFTEIWTSHLVTNSRWRDITFPIFLVVYSSIAGVTSTLLPVTMIGYDFVKWSNDQRCVGWGERKEIKVYLYVLDYILTYIDSMGADGRKFLTFLSGRLLIIVAVCRRSPTAGRSPAFRKERPGTNAMDAVIQHSIIVNVSAAETWFNSRDLEVAEEETIVLMGWQPSWRSSSMIQGDRRREKEKAVKRSDRQTEPAVLLISNCFSSEYCFSRYFIIRKKDFFEADPH